MMTTGASAAAAVIGGLMMCFMLGGCAAGEAANGSAATTLHSSGPSWAYRKDGAGAGDRKGSIMAKDWGEANGQPVKLFTLTNANGLTAKITNYGGILTEMHVPGRDGKMTDVVLGFDSLEKYLAGHPFFGAIAGRVANRIAHGRFELAGQTYQLATNDGPNHLHGGNEGFDKKVWDAQPSETPAGPALKLTYTSPAGQEGYPGELTATVVYTLTNDDELRIEYNATADAPTLINLTHHSYWNLAGHASGNVLPQVLKLFADRYTPTDETLIPTGEIKPVQGTPYDFTNAKKIGADIEQVKGGYDVNFVVNGQPGRLRPAARLREPKSGRVMEVYTTQPGIQVYTSGMLAKGKGPIEGKGAATYDRFDGICLETQHFPDAINQPNFASPILQPDDTYRHVAVYRFTVE